jgi:hypothetical protein
MQNRLSGRPGLRRDRAPLVFGIALITALIAFPALPIMVYAYQIGPNPNPLNGAIIVNTPDAVNGVGIYFNNYGLLEITATGTLTNAGTLNNNGTLNNLGTLISSGTLNIIAAGTLNNLGTLTAANIVNNDQFNYSAGILNTNLDNNATGTTTLSGPGTRTINGNVNTWGLFIVTETTAVYTGTFNNYGSYISDPSTQEFLGDLTVGPNGFIIAGDGDIFKLFDNFINNSTENNSWKTDMSDLIFTTGLDNIHDFWLAGADFGSGGGGFLNNFAWGLMDISGNVLNLLDGNSTPGAALYVHELLGAEISGNTITNIFGHGFNIYYNPSDPLNNYLLAGTFMLADGGTLGPTGGGQPVPEPATVLLLGSGLICLWGFRKKFKK